MITCRCLQFPVCKSFNFLFTNKTVLNYRYVSNLKRSFDKSLSSHSYNQSFLSWSLKTSRHNSTYPEIKSLPELEQFTAVSKIIHNDLVDYKDEALLDAIDWCSKVYEYNLKHGKKNRGTTVLKAYKVLSNPPTSEGLVSASILGWCVELLQAFLLILDDIMDQSTTRRGELCWYKKPEVGLVAINDALMLQSGIYKILRKHFVDCLFYSSIVHEFLQATERTIYGQCLDMLSNPPHDKPNYEKFTIQKYEAIVEYKTSYYTFCLPVHLAMHLVGGETTKEFLITTKLCLKLGLLFQVQDDYLDCYGDPKITGKQGTDIGQGKCSWFAVTFLENANESLKKEWMKNYGIPQEENVSKILSLYEKEKVLEKYIHLEQKLTTEIKSLISNEISDQHMKDVFHYLLETLHKRQK